MPPAPSPHSEPAAAAATRRIDGHTIRAAGPADAPALVALENRCFATDRLSLRNFRHLLSAKAHARTVVATGDGGTIEGYAMVLFNRGTSLARLYSIAVDPDARGRGIGRALLRAADAVAEEHGAVYLRLEVRAEDAPTRALYHSEGFRTFGTHAGYYEDGMDAVRMEKRLVTPADLSQLKVPFYAQSLDFTCGPASLMMALRALHGETPFSATEELTLWRESTTIFMTSGHGGCSPHGLALAAVRRGFAAEIHVSDPGPLFIDSVRSTAKKDAMRVVHADFEARARDAAIPVSHAPLPLAGLRRRFDEGWIPLVLISSYRFDRQKQPHWVVVTGFDERFVYIHDPFVDYAEGRTPTDCIRIPVPLSAFERMARYGRSRLKAVVLVSTPPAVAQEPEDPACPPM